MGYTAGVAVMTAHHNRKARSSARERDHSSDPYRLPDPEQPASTARKRRAKPYPYEGADLRAPDIKEGDVLVPLRKAKLALSVIEGIRGFVLFGAFFAFYFMHTAQLFNTSRANRSVAWYRASHRSSYDLVADDESGWCLWQPNNYSCYEPFEGRGSVPEVVQFLDKDVGVLLRGIERTCPACRVALSSRNRDLRTLSLREMICSDFAFVPDFATDDDPTTDVRFPLRDCATANAAWRASPEVSSAPCCDDTELGLASLTLLALDQQSPTPSAPLELLTGESHKAALIHWVESALSSDGVVLQVVVMTEDMQAMGVTYAAATLSKYLPGACGCSLSYWAYNFAPDWTWLSLAAVFCAFSSLHEGLEQLGMAASRRQALRNLFQPFMLLVELPTIFLPWVLEGAARLFDLRIYAFLVALVQLLMFGRLFQEGQVLPPFRLVVRTLIFALPQLLWFTVAVGSTVCVFAGINMQMFGPVDSGFGNFGDSFMSMFSVVIEGAPNDGPGFEYVPVGANAMFLVTNLFLFLIVAQFFIAILVGSFDQTCESELARHKQLALPRGCEDVGEDPPPGALLRRLGNYLLRYRMWGTFTPTLARQMRALLREAEQRAQAAALSRGEQYEPGPLLFTHPQLKAALGPRVAGAFSLEYGAEVTHPELLPDNAIFRKLTPGEKPRAQKPPPGASQLLMRQEAEVRPLPLPLAQAPPRAAPPQEAKQAAAARHAPPAQAGSGARQRQQQLPASPAGASPAQPAREARCAGGGGAAECAPSADPHAGAPPSALLAALAPRASAPAQPPARSASTDSAAACGRRAASAPREQAARAGGGAAPLVVRPRLVLGPRAQRSLT